MMQTEIANRTNNCIYKISKTFKSKSNQSSTRILHILSYTLYYKSSATQLRMQELNL